MVEKGLYRVFRFLFLLLVAVASVYLFSPFASAQDDKIYFGNIARYESEQVLFHPGLMFMADRTRLDMSTAQLYGMKDLNIRNGFAVIPRKDSRIGLSFSTFGNKSYTETGIGIIYSFPLYRSIILSNELRYYAVSITGYERISDKSFTTGFVYCASRIQAGIRFLNIFSSGNAHTGDARNKGCQLVCFFDLTPRLRLSVGHFIQDNYPSVTALDGRITVQKSLVLLVSTGHDPRTYSLGTEILLNRFTCFYRWKRHEKLGNTSYLGFGLIF